MTEAPTTLTIVNKKPKEVLYSNQQLYDPDVFPDGGVFLYCGREKTSIGRKTVAFVASDYNLKNVVVSLCPPYCGNRAGAGISFCVPPVNRTEKVWRRISPEITITIPDSE